MLQGAAFCRFGTPTNEESERGRSEKADPRAFMAHLTQAATPFSIVWEIGIPGQFDVNRFASEEEARARAKAFWCCWVLFELRADGDMEELATGGVGFPATRNAIRKHAYDTLSPLFARVAFANKRDKAVGDPAIAAGHRVAFGIVYPADMGISSCHMFFDKQKPVESLVASAANHAGLMLDKGKLPGSPERLNLFTLDGDLVRLDLEVEAHLGSTLRTGDVLVLEKGNRLMANRIKAIRRVLELPS